MQNSEQQNVSAAPAFAEAEFRKARRSEPNKACVAVARRDGLVAVRDTKTAFGSPSDRHLLLTEDDFDAAQAAWRSRDFQGPVRLHDTEDGGSTLSLQDQPDAPELRFTGPETVAFLDGVYRHEFDRPSG